MIRLTNDINATLRAEVTDVKISVSCVTRHRGDIGARVEAKMRIAEALAIDPDNRSVQRQMNRILGEE